MTSADAPHTRLLAGYRADPRGIPARDTMLSWTPAGPGPYRVTVTDLDDGAATWTATSERPFVLLPAAALRPAARYTWTVDGSAAASFETGLDQAGWEAAWIAAPATPFAREDYDPAPYLRAEFELAERGDRARVYATALGIYRMWVNGTEVTADALLRPGWTDYDTRVLHQTYDATDLLVEGTNTIAVLLGRGWYAGRLGLQWAPSLYGTRPAFLAQVETATGTDRRVVAGTGAGWRTAPGAVIASDLLRGEIADLRREHHGWTGAGFDDAGWSPVELPAPGVAVHPQPHADIRVLRAHPGVLVHQHARGPAIFDFGQNLVGWLRIESELTPGADVIVRHGEILTPDKLVYRDNLRGAFQEDRFVDDAEGRRTLEPRFGMHGFRYAEIWGLKNTNGAWHLAIPEESTVTALSMDAGQELIGSFACSDEALTAFAGAVEWTVRDNFLEVATDCPQRDERLGWLGDAGVISPTASYFFDVAAFLAKFSRDAADAQWDDGSVPSYVPVVPPGNERHGAPGWADGYVRMVSLLVRRYGDLASAEEYFDSLLRYLEFVDRENPDGIRVNAVGSDFSDWLSLPDRDDDVPHPGYAYTGAFSTSPKPVVATAHTYRSLCQVADIARRLGRDEDAARLDRRAEEVRTAYRERFVGADGRFEDATQTVYAQAIGYGLLRDEEAQRAADLLREHIEKRGYVTTGIHGVEHVLPALARHGHADLAAELLLRREMPSWLYMVERGATTVWEKWDGIRPDGSLATAEMNSFNHCALGAVGGFLFEDVLGLRLDGAVWGDGITVAPVYLTGLDWAEGAHRGPTGPVSSRWERDGARVKHLLELPATGPARFVAPAGYAIAVVDGAAADGTAIDLSGGRHELILERR
ncbi:alpha-L-rhamnosidase [Nocardioides sp. L-11A]|uniref:alpha-L-rhamnosidase n=1 Tax=Nocardioides sp. L-11A TaxID=3043848 RepID=UPI00249BF334|nr:family 78 glycoside hydrolase catalytic domain [Nocardioides sp. L-11A]